MTTVTHRDVTASEAETAAAEAFLFGYPLVLMGRMRGRTPANAFVHERAPRAPGAQAVDALSSTAWLDLSGEPMVLSVPASHGHYYMLSLVDMWTTVFASLGPRTTGAGAGNYAIAGPHSSGGALPAGVQPIAAPTSTVRVAARFQLERCDGTRAHALQDACRVTPLSAWTHHHRAGVPAVEHPPTSRLAPAEQLEGVDARTFFSELAALLEAHPPLPGDRALVERLRRTGVLPRPGKPPSTDPDLLVLRERGVRRGLERLRAAAADPPAEAAGHWQVRYGLVASGTDHLDRAAAACAGEFSSRAADEVEAVISRDSDGRPLSGAHAYRLRFDDQPPPVRGFWSLSSGRACIGDADGLTIGTDGSLTLALHPDPPGGRTPRANWLPVPRGEFSLALRLFWPAAEVLERRWSPPAVVRTIQGGTA
jgi:hypothetical protein